MTRAGPYGQSFASKYLKEGKYPEALASSTEAIEADEDDPDNYLERAQAYLAMERYEEAVNDLIVCVARNKEAQSADEDAIDDTLFTALVDWGKTLSSKDPKAAISLLQRYNQILPNGSKQEELKEWTRWFNGESKVLIKNKT